MRDYSYLPEELLQAVRSLPNYQSYLKRTATFDMVNALRSSILADDIRAISIIDMVGVRYFQDAIKCVHNAYMRTSRARKRISDILDIYGNVYFITFTIDDDHISKGIQTLFDEAVKCCSLCSTLWVCNQDFGDRFGRLHFHACCSGDKVDPILIFKDSYEFWVNGFSYIEVCNKEFIDDDSLDKRRIARYVTKLARHATKYSTNNWIRYSRLNKNV